jgi:succinate dehydrogenase/fumarate reductase flavoprotein subunit
VPGLYAAGDLACVPHNYMVGAFVFGDLAGADAAISHVAPGPLDEEQVAAAHELVYRPLRNPDGPPQPQVEYKLRRFVNDYVAPPKTAAKLEIAVETFTRMAREIEARRADAARADAMRGGELHPRLRRAGHPGLPRAHREPVGALPRARRPAGA